MLIAKRTQRFLMAWLMALVLPAAAAPWAEVGNSSLRSDLELLVAHRLIAGPVSLWPIPAAQLRVLRQQAALADQPIAVQAAAQRILAAMQSADGPSTEAGVSGISRLNAIRAFGDTERAQYESRAGVMAEVGDVSGALRIHVYAGDEDTADRRHWSLDGSYLNTSVGGWQLYGGWVDQWYGPGQVSSLILSDNARPMPKLGLMRDNPQPFTTPWLAWLGPWQVNFFLGLLDDPQRLHHDTGYGAFRLMMVPLPGLELGLSRTSEFCGSGLPCRPLSAAFDIRNGNASTNSSNDEGAIDIRYAMLWRGVEITPYLQLMNEDTNPFQHSYSTYLAGFSSSGAWGRTAAIWRLSAEYTDSRATLNLFSFGGRDAVGLAYNNGMNRDGMRFYNRTLGFSLDSDSTLASLLAAVTTAGGTIYRLALHNAQISTAELAAAQTVDPFFRNAVSARPVSIHQLELGLRTPWRS
jgi:Capsule assembly protein Wzi